MLGKRLDTANRIARKRFTKWNGHSPEKMPEKEKQCFLDPTLKSVLGLLRKTNVRCSNPLCCGNSRHIRGATHISRQEQKAEVSFKEQYGC